MMLVASAFRVDVYEVNLQDVGNPGSREAHLKIMELLKPGESKHHLFTQPEIRAKLVEVYGDPQTDDDHRWLHETVRRLHRQGPTVMIDDEFHRAIHTKK